MATATDRKPTASFERAENTRWEQVVSSKASISLMTSDDLHPSFLSIETTIIEALLFLIYRHFASGYYTYTFGFI